MPSLFDPNLKLQWAKEHLDALDRELALLKQSNTQRLSTEDDLENGWYIVRVDFPSNPRQFTVALISGDFISCLRSSLDHLAWQLALLTTDTPSRDICFPICEKNSLDTQLRIVKSTYGIPDAAVSIMKSLQPYNSGDAYKSTHLWRLNKLWNVDKHRHIMPHEVVTDWLFQCDAAIDVMTESFEDGGVMKFPLAFKDKVKLNPDVGTDVVFGGRKEGFTMSFGDFVAIYEFVANSVMPAFASFFPQ